MAILARREESASPRETINLRASAEQKALIDRAASRLGKTRTDFMLDSAREAAEDTLLDQRQVIVALRLGIRAGRIRSVKLRDKCAGF